MGVDTYLTVAFWIGAVAIFLRAFSLGTNDYPKKIEVSVGAEVILLLSTVGFFVWVCFLKFGG
ncbi:hypothetical protein HN682_09940 [Candidatus Peregrinibacteria bacterium]|jgi:hypothetical protein|nr:hypothetical protein [Candidatus Scalindua sp.]MBT7349916.1 hypothetical protein [candidate division WWE3 bacterium]MBT7930203.1 hypothetical protein [Candidatus Peregrinibacteria bacterium]